MGEEKQVFRQKSLDRLESPEQLNDYIRVMNPGVWFLIASILVLLVGVVVWGVFGKIGKTTIDNSVTLVSSGQVRCYLDEEDLPDDDEFLKDATISVASLGENTVANEYSVAAIEWITLPTENESEMQVLKAVGYHDGEKVMQLTAPCDLADGLYTAKVTFAGKAPISLLDK